MGSVCSCFHASDVEDQHHGVGSNNGVIHTILNKFAALFNRQEMQATPPSIPQTAPRTSTTVLDNALFDTTRSSPQTILINAGSACSGLKQDGHASKQEGTSHLPVNNEPLTVSNIQMGLKSVNGQDKPNGSYCKEAVQECHPETSVKLPLEKVTNEPGDAYLSSEDEDVCPTCLEEYTLENPKIIAQCSHHYHLGCIYEWMERSENCPVCGKLMMFNETG